MRSVRISYYVQLYIFTSTCNTIPWIWWLSLTTYYCGAWADTMGNSFLFDQTWEIEVKKMGVGCSEKKKKTLILFWMLWMTKLNIIPREIWMLEQFKELWGCFPPFPTEWKKRETRHVIFNPLLTDAPQNGVQLCYWMVYGWFSVRRLALHIIMNNKLSHHCRRYKSLFSLDAHVAKNFTVAFHCCL